MTEAGWMAATDPDRMFEFLSSPMIRKLKRKPSERKLRFFAASCCRRIWNRISDDEVIRGHAFLVKQCGAADQSEDITSDCGRRAIEVAEKYADGLVGSDELSRIREAVHQLTYVSEYYAASKPTVIGRDETDYGYLTTGAAALAAEEACSFVERLTYAAHHASRAAAYLRCSPTEPLPQPKHDASEQRHQSLIVQDIFGNPFRPVAIDPSWLTSDVRTLAKGIYQERAFDRMPILADALQDAGCDNEYILNHCRSESVHVRGCWVVDLLLGKS